ncbi:hypothetical protein ID866_4833 [Astraeus odoratus]|nr:hypothetical protein ID866_4833 [Astraeus odoratus]
MIPVKSLMTPFFVLMSLLVLVMPMPLYRQKRDVFVPPVLYPHEGTVWIVGQYHNVTWDTSNAPANITNPLGKIYLVVNNLIDFDYLLADGFNILDGRTVVQVPDVQTGDGYAVVLFGDSGNWSHNFTIKSE